MPNHRTGAWFDELVVGEAIEHAVSWTVAETDDFSTTSTSPRPLDPPPGVRRSPALDGGSR